MGEKNFQQAQTLNSETLEQIYAQLLAHYGPQHWWPGDSAFEIMVGAILTQNTAWSNVQRAIDNLAKAGLLELRAMQQTAPDELAELIRPAGYYNLKARRLLHLCRFLSQSGELDQLSETRLRALLLSVHGIGPETADAILLYAFQRPVFVIDAYTRRLFYRLGLVPTKLSYELLRRAFELALGADAGLFNEYHALIVRHAKQTCRSQPRCTLCCLGAFCQQRLEEPG